MKSSPAIRGAPVVAATAMLWGALACVALGEPALSPAAREAAARRLDGRLILVTHDRPAAAPDGTPAAPFGDVKSALERARSGDVIFCEGAAKRHVSEAFVVPDGVLLTGSPGAIVHVKPDPDLPATDLGPLVSLRGSAAIEGLIITSQGEASRAALVGASGEDAKPTLLRCALIPADGAFAAFQALHRAAPVLCNCLVISPVGDYGVFARHDARPVLDHCTIISRGFGVGMMDRSLAKIDRCIIAGQCPGIISDGAEFGLTRSVIWCPAASEQFHHPVIMWRYEPAGQNDSRLVQVNLTANLRPQEAMLVDPRFAGRGAMQEFFAPAPGSEAASRGAFAGEHGEWPAAPVGAAPPPLPRTEAYLPAAAKSP